MYSNLKDENFSHKEVYSSGKYGICPLNDNGFEQYLSHNSYNYHFLNKTDPMVIKEILDEMNQKEKQLQSEKNLKTQVQSQPQFSEQKEKVMQEGKKVECAVNENNQMEIKQNVIANKQVNKQIPKKTQGVKKGAGNPPKMKMPKISYNK